MPKEKKPGQESFASTQKKLRATGDPYYNYMAVKRDAAKKDLKNAISARTKKEKK